MLTKEIAVVNDEYILADEIENYSSYKSVHIHSVYGIVAFITNHPTYADMIPIKADTTYPLDYVFKIVKKGDRKAYPSIVATFYE